MKVPGPDEQPYYEQWAPGKTRKTLSGEELEKLNERMKVYTLRRFKLGRRFRLTKDYGGIPKGTGVTVVSEWPRTMVRYDKWSARGYGAQRRCTDLSRRLDDLLEYVEGG